MAYGETTDGSGRVVDQFFSGGVRVALADVNGDNINDILTGAGPGGAPMWRLSRASTWNWSSAFL